MSYYLNKKDLLQACEKSTVDIKRVNEIVVDVLNDVHQTSHSLRYWNIVVGPYVRYLVENYTHYSLIPKSKKTLTEKVEIMITGNFATFRSQIMSDEIGVEFSALMEHFKTNDLKSIKVKTSKKIIINNRTFFKKIISIYNYLVKLAPEKRIICITFVPKPSLFLNIIFKLRLLPFLLLKDELLDSENNADLDLREKIFNRISSNKSNAFLPSNFWKLFCILMPLSYIENYKKSLDYGAKKYGKPVKIILTEDIHSWDIFKIWTANSVLMGTKLTIAQHGAGYGTAESEYAENHEVDVADLFLSWFKSTKKNVIQVPSKNFIRRNNKYKFYSVLVNSSFSKGFYKYCGGPINEQILQNLDDQFIFLRHLESKILSSMKVRQPNTINKFQYINKTYEKSGFDSLVDKDSKYYSLISEARLVVSSYAGTSWQETLMNNIPTVIFFDPLAFPKRLSVHPYLGKLSKVGILHYSPKLAANQINKVFPDIDKWWNSSELQDARQDFCRRFGYTEKKWAKKWTTSINSILD